MELTIDQALQKGIEAHKAGQVQEADRLYTAILKAQPKHPDANHNMGALAVGVGKFQEALPFFKTALEANPNTAQFWLSYIDTLIKLERLADAKAVLDQAKSEGGAKGDGFDQLEERLSIADKAPDEAAPEKNQKHPSILNTLKLVEAIKLAQKKAKDSSLEEARQIYQDILVKFPNNKAAIDGLKALTGGDVGDKSKVQDPPPAELQSLVNLYSQGQLQQTLKQAETLIQRFPRSPTLHNIQGAVLRGLGQLDLSIKAFKKALAIRPDFADVYYNMGNALKEQGKLEEALEAFNKALVIKPDYAVAWNNMGLIFQGQGKLEEAIDAYKKALAIKHDYADVYTNMGNALKEQGKKVEALEAYKKALAIKPGSAEAHNNIGIALKEQGKLEEAIKAYKKALAIKPDYAESYNNMGTAFKDQGKLKEAIKAYNKALAIKPDYWNAKHMLSSLTGKTTKTAPREYVENLFDAYARNFDETLVEKLEYNIPRILTDLTVGLHGSGSLGSVLDLGCGTGLTGVEIKEFCSSLEGIDLSNQMLERARTKRVYDKLSHVDIVEYLSNTVLNFDFFISTDVFIYVGELSDVFRLIKSQNRKPGKLVFSTEHTEKDGFHIEKSGRYSHSKSYIEGLCEQFNYSISHFSQTNLRKEKGKFLTGGIYLLDF